MADVKKDWIDKANSMLRKNPNMSKQEVIDSLKKQGLDRPTGIEGKGPRRFGPKSRSVGGRSRRKAQEQVSTQQSSEFTKKQRQLMSEDVGIAQHAGMEEPFFEHKYSQDVSGLLEEGAPGDYVDRFPEQSSAFKTEAERINRQNYRNRFAILTTPTGFRAVPREYFSELADPFSLPGIDLDETVSIKKQLDQGFSNLKFGKGAVRFKPGKFTRGLTRLALPSAAGSALSLALGAEDVKAREQLAEQDPSFINVLQRDLAYAERGADIAGAVPNPASPVAETTGLLAGGGNLLIDVARDPIGALQTIGGGIKFVANEYVLGVPNK